MNLRDLIIEYIEVYSNNLHEEICEEIIDEILCRVKAQLGNDDLKKNIFDIAVVIENIVSNIYL